MSNIGDFLSDAYKAVGNELPDALMVFGMILIVSTVASYFVPTFKTLEKNRIFILLIFVVMTVGRAIFNALT